MGAFDGIGRSAIDVPGVARIRHRGDQPARDFFGADGRAYDGVKLLALARNFPDSVRYQDQKHWGQQEIWDRPQRLTELNGKILLIVGFGSIGQEVARRAKAFGMRVWAVNRSGQGDGSLAEKIVPNSKLGVALSAADFVVIAAPETADTKHLIGAKEIARMKHGARLINVSRGSLLDEKPL